MVNPHELFQIAEAGTSEPSVMYEEPIVVWAEQASRLFERTQYGSPLPPNADSEWKVNLMYLNRGQRLGVKEHIAKQIELYGTLATESQKELSDLLRVLESQQETLGFRVQRDESLRKILEENVRFYARIEEIWKGTASYFNREFLNPSI